MDPWEVYFKRNEKVTWRILGDDCILLHLKSGIYYTLNKSGKFLWELLNGEKKLTDIQDEMMDYFEVYAETLKDDLLEIIEDMMKEDLIEYHENPPADSSIS